MIVQWEDGLEPADTLIAPPTHMEAVRRLDRTFQPEWSKLFGSRAAGAASPDSDFDLMVLVENSAESSCRGCAAGTLPLWCLDQYALGQVSVCQRGKIVAVRWFEEYRLCKSAAKVPIRKPIPFTCARSDH